MLKEKRKAMEDILGLMGQSMKETGRKIKFRVMEFISNCITLRVTMGSGRMVKNQVLEFSSIRMAKFIQDSLSRIKNKVLEYIIGKMGVGMRDGGLTINSMD